MKKTFIICGLILISFVTFCFETGYRLPERDHHKDWTTLEQNKDPNYMIEPVFPVTTVIKLSPELLMLVNTREMIILNGNGTVLRKFNISDPIYIDELHHRLITGRPATSNSHLINYFSYDLKDLSERPTQLIDYPLTEIFTDFARRKGMNSRQYRAAHAKDVLFFSTLHPVISVSDNNKNPQNVKYYTDGSGKLYNIRPLADTSFLPLSTSYEAFMISMDILCPAWGNVPDLSFKPLQSTNFQIAGKSTIVSNHFNFDPGINFSPGGKDHGIEMSFEQNYLNYYAIRLKNSVVHFKIYDKVPVTYDKTALNKFMQLNIPGSDRDTLAFIYDGELYKVHRIK